MHAVIETKPTLHDLVELVGSRAYLPIVPAQLLDGRRAGKEVDEVAFSEERRRRTTGFRFPTETQTMWKFGCWCARRIGVRCTLFRLPSGPDSLFTWRGPCQWVRALSLCWSSLPPAELQPFLAVSRHAPAVPRRITARCVQ